MYHRTTSDGRECHDIDMVYPNLLKYYKFNEQKDLVITTAGYAINPYVLDNLIRQVQLKIPVSKGLSGFPLKVSLMQKIYTLMGLK